MKPDYIFQRLLLQTLADGSYVSTRNADTLRTRNQMMTFEQFPIISMRRTAWKNALREFEWFMSGSNDINDLHPKVKHWWEPWANESGFIHNNYSKQFRQFDGANHTGGTRHLDPKGTDQIKYLIDEITNNPFSRRTVATTWHSHDMVSPVTPITNCHGSLIQAFVEPDDNTLHLTMYQRSADMVLGLPHNLVQYWAFLMYLAHQGNREVGSFTWIGGDCHIYNDHIHMAKKMIKLDVDKVKDVELVYTPSSDDFKADDFTLSDDYKPIIKESVSMTV